MAAPAGAASGGRDGGPGGGLDGADPGGRAGAVSGVACGGRSPADSPPHATTPTPRTTTISQPASAFTPPSLALPAAQARGWASK